MSICALTMFAERFAHELCSTNAAALVLPAALSEPAPIQTSPPGWEKRLPSFPSLPTAWECRVQQTGKAKPGSRLQAPVKETPFPCGSAGSAHSAARPQQTQPGRGGSPLKPRVLQGREWHKTTALQGCFLPALPSRTPCGTVPSVLHWEWLPSVEAGGCRAETEHHHLHTSPAHGMALGWHQDSIRLPFPCAHLEAAPHQRARGRKSSISHHFTHFQVAFVLENSFPGHLRLLTLQSSGTAAI